jgi:hypothetical protein
MPLNLGSERDWGFQLYVLMTARLLTGPITTTVGQRGAQHWPNTLRNGLNTEIGINRKRISSGKRQAQNGQIST